MQRLIRYKVLCLLLALFSTTLLRAEHFSGSSITYECIGSNYYVVYLDLYLDCSGAPMAIQTLHFNSSCGLSFDAGSLQFPLQLTVSEDVSPLCAADAGSGTCNGGTLPGYWHYRYQTTVYLAPCDLWTIDWYVCCRHTMVNLYNTPGIYAQATLNNLDVLCDKSPRFVDDGVPHVCVNAPVSFNPGATDPDGSTMNFSLVSALFGSPTPLPVDYMPGYTATEPIPGITLNTITGQINFTPTISGFYVIVVQVKTYTPSGVYIGTVMRDIMFVVLPCDGVSPQSTGLSNVPSGLLTGPNSVAACPGEPWCVDFVFSDSDPNQTIEIASNALTLLPGATFTITGNNPATATLCWTNNTNVLPINIFIEADDGACPIPNVTSRSIFVSDCVLLPVELVSFDAITERYAVRTRWTTATESNNSHFEVQRSSDGVEFEKIGLVNGAGTVMVTQHYEFLDLNPIDGLSYYRLSQVDLDGTVSFSNAIPVIYKKQSTLVVQPISSGGWRVSGLTDASDWSLVDITGRIIHQGNFDGGDTQFIPNVDLPPSILILVIHSGADQQQVKINSFGIFN